MGDNVHERYRSVLPLTAKWYKLMPPEDCTPVIAESDGSDAGDTMLDIPIPGFLHPNGSDKAQSQISSHRGSLLNFYEIGDPAELESNIDPDEPEKAYDASGCFAYEKACERYGAVFCRRYAKKLRMGFPVSMQNYGLGPAGIKSVALPLNINLTCTSIDLKGNPMDDGALECLELVMKDNQAIKELNLSGTKVGKYGAQRICEIIRSNSCIQMLDLSANEFSDRQGTLLAEALEENRTLVDVDLSVNAFGIFSAESFGILIADNPILMKLNLSWNQFRLQGSIEIAEGLNENTTLKVLNLAWNGFHDAGAEAISEALASNRSLEELDLTSNRIGDKGLAHLINALQSNTTLKKLHLDNNPIKEEPAKEALMALALLPSLGLQEISFWDNIYSKSFADHVALVKNNLEKLEINWGYNDQFGKKKLDKGAVDEAFRFLQAYTAEQNINLAELFASLDQDGSMSVTYDEFRSGLEDAGIPLTPQQINDLIMFLDADGDGEIDFSELIIGTDVHDKQLKEAEAEEVLPGPVDDEEPISGGVPPNKANLRSGTSFSKQGKPPDDMI